MKDEVLNLTYASSLTDLCEVNPSFDTGILRIAYAGENRNRTCISKGVFEKCIKTIYNCPIVCNYDRESDTIGGHDVEAVKDSAGHITLVNKTAPVGCIPESSRVFWETVTEDDGVEREYLCAEVLLWKRQEAYDKIKDNGITAQSMEITVKDGEYVDGIYHINDFVFTAFALIGVCPCFESAALDTREAKAFSFLGADDDMQESFKTQMSKMMQEIKESFSLTDNSGCNNEQKGNLMKGGERRLDEKKIVKDDAVLDIPDISTEADNNPEGGSTFSLIENMLEELRDALSVETTHTDWGEWERYCYADCDIELGKVYAWDREDWLLYGFDFKLDGDRVVIDFTTKKRMKYIISEFNEGESQPSPIEAVYAAMEEQMEDVVARETNAWKSQYQEVCGKYSALNDEVVKLREFKSETEAAFEDGKRKEVFAQFDDLAGIEQFEALKDNCKDYDLDTLKEKCFAIRGRKVTDVNFNFELEQKLPKVKIEKDDKGSYNSEPYGGLFEKYGFTAKD